MIYITGTLTNAYKEANAQPMVLFDNLLTQGTIASSTSPTATPRANAVTGDTFDYYQPASVPESFQCTFGASQTANCAFFDAHTLGTEGASIDVQYFNGSTWVTETTITPTDDSPILAIFPDRAATGWGFRVTTAIAQIGVAIIGQRLVIPGGVQPEYTPVWSSLEIVKLGGTSRRGHFFGQRVERRGARMQPNFMPVTHSFALTTMKAFRNHYDEGRPFAWASAPSVFSEDVAYCRAPDGATVRTPILAGGQLVSLSLDLEAFVA